MSNQSSAAMPRPLWVVLGFTSALGALALTAVAVFNGFAYGLFGAMTQEGQCELPGAHCAEDYARLHWTAILGAGGALCLAATAFYAYRRAYGSKQRLV